jgi:hypothetical protein
MQDEHEGTRIVQGRVPHAVHGSVRVREEVQQTKYEFGERALVRDQTTTG